MMVGEAPGAREDETGRPFVGRSGRLLTELLGEIGIDRSDVFITSVLKCRPPRNRAPAASEIERCLPYLLHQIDIIRPEVVVLLGGVAISSVVGPWRVSEAHGRFYEADSLKMFMTYHPAAALRSRTILDLLRHDLRVLQRELIRVGVISATSH